MDFRQEALNRLKILSDSFLYTPSKDEVQKAVEDFFSSDAGEGWIEAAIRLDPALQKKREPGAPVVTNGGGKEKVEPIEGAIDQLLTYQGLHAIALHQKAHKIYNEARDNFDNGNFVGAARKYFEARKISQGTRRITAGIEIHPGATIGKDFFIDHGAGIVVGETCEIGNDVFLYHGVTLGAYPGKTVLNAKGGERRHPKLENDVVVGSEAQILGPITLHDKVKIGAGAKLVGNIVVKEGATIGAGVEIIGDVVIEDGARIEAGAKIISPKKQEGLKPNGKPNIVEQKIEIGKDSIIEAGITVHENVKPEVHVSGVMPFIPGLIAEREGAGSPIYRNKNAPGLAIVNSRWDGIAIKLQQMLHPD